MNNVSNNIFIKNVYYMLSYAFKSLKKVDDQKINVEEFENIHDIFAAILSKGIGIQLKQGLYREYISKTEDLSVVKGKIDIHGTIKNQMANKMKVCCEFDELSENNIFNQILKTTSMLLISSDKVNSDLKAELRKEMLFFSNVDEILPGSIKWQTLRFQRNNQLYRTLISICQLVLEGMLLTTESGDYKLSSFIDDQRMCRLYEKFILEYYRKHYPTLFANASQIKWAVEDDEGLGTFLPVMQTDITLTNRSGNKVLIIDAKYYGHNTQVQYNKNTVHSNNMYQIFTYVKNKEYELKEKGAEVSGMLLYAKTKDEIQPNGKCKIGGNTIEVNNLDMEQDFEEIKKQLNRIADFYFN